MAVETDTDVTLTGVIECQSCERTRPLRTSTGVRDVSFFFQIDFQNSMFFHKEALNNIMNNLPTPK